MGPTRKTAWSQVKKLVSGGEKPEWEGEQSTGRLQYHLVQQLHILSVPFGVQLGDFSRTSPRAMAGRILGSPFACWLNHSSLQQMHWVPLLVFHFWCPVAVHAE